MIDPHSALIYTMVLVSAADREMSDSELRAIGDIVKQLPVFRDFDAANLASTAQDCAEALNTPKGLDRVLDRIVEGLPSRLRETAYALACEIAAADGKASQEELRLLELLRHRLEVGRLVSAAIERGVRARHVRL